MERDTFRKILNYLIDKFQPRVTFEFDDYFDQVMYVPESYAKDLRKKIIEECDYFPKPAELRKIAKDYKIPYQQPTQHPNINYDNCMVHHDRPVYKSLADPYSCKECFEHKQNEIALHHKRYKELNYPVDSWNKKENSQLKQLLEKVKHELSL